MKYYFSKSVALSFAEAIDKVTEELKKEGFGILTDIDVKQTLKKKLDVDFPNYRIPIHRLLIALSKKKIRSEQCCRVMSSFRSWKGVRLRLRP